MRRSARVFNLLWADRDRSSREKKDGIVRPLVGWWDTVGRQVTTVGGNAIGSRNQCCLSQVNIGCGSAIGLPNTKRMVLHPPEVVPKLDPGFAQSQRRPRSWGEKQRGGAIPAAPYIGLPLVGEDSISPHRSGFASARSAASCRRADAKSRFGAIGQRGSR